MLVYTLEVIQGFLIQLHIKPTKVLTKNNYLSQKFFWKKVRPFGNKNSKFQKTVIKKSPQYERILKISMHGWRAWSEWFFTILTFFAPVIYWSIFQDVMDQKMTRAKKVTLKKISFFMPINLVKYFFIFVYALALFSWLNSETLQGSCQIVLPQRPIFFRPKLVLLLMSTSSLMQ